MTWSDKIWLHFYHEMDNLEFICLTLEFYYDSDMLELAIFQHALGAKFEIQWSAPRFMAPSLAP